MSFAWFHDLTGIQRALILGGVIACAVLAGAAVIMLVQKAMTKPADDRGDWVKTLVEYKNLRDDGVLSEEEYRKIRTLVEPRIESGGGLVAGDQGPAARRCG